MKKYVLCRPRGGLNDTLCQIEKCWNYCINFNRMLIIDTTKSGIFINLSDLFIDKSNSGFEFNLTEELVSTINKLDCQIKELNGKIDEYESEYTKESNYVEKITKKQITFDMQIDYKESLLIYEQCGGGVDSLELLKKLKLSDVLRDNFKKNIILESYKSIHVRNTDYKTDYHKLFHDIKSELKDENVLVCSDSKDVIECAKIILKDSKIITKTSNNFVKSGEPLHSVYNKYTNDEKRILTENSIIDLLLLASSEKIYYSKLSGYDFNKLSGFTRLSLLLNENKEIIENIIN